jgi:hypothetical protein
LPREINVNERVVAAGVRTGSGSDRVIDERGISATVREGDITSSCDSCLAP